jgi:hypothetical protein
VGAQYSGLFGFTIETGRWSTAFGVLVDGTFVDGHDVEIEAISLDAEVWTRRAMASAMISSGKRSRLDVVNTTGLSLPLEAGKGRATLRDMIVRRCGKDAAAIIAAVEARVEVQKAA